MADEPKLPPFIRFHWVKSQYFRVIHADGAYGGLTPYGGVFCCLYSDRIPIPTVTAQVVQKNGQVGEEIADKKEGPDGIEREVETCFVMNLTTAKSLRDLLDTRIKLLESMQPEQQHQESGAKS
jgi:hypothetical protein